MATETITIEVDAETARAFREASPERQREMTSAARLQMLSMVRPPRPLEEVMREMSEMAEQRGMTPEILKDILGEDELHGCL